jgi:hypothetical protein
MDSLSFLDSGSSDGEDGSVYFGKSTLKGLAVNGPGFDCGFHLLAGGRTNLLEHGLEQRGYVVEVGFDLRYVRL